MSGTPEVILCPLECVNQGCPQPDFLEKHDGFLITLIGSLSAVLGVIFSYCIKSRCKNIKTCCISCDRDVIEIKKENIEINNIS
jgi:hypothetical protein